MYYAAAAAAAAVLAGYTQTCDLTNKCRLKSQPDLAAAPPTSIPGKFYSCDGPISSTYTAARNQTISNCYFDGDVVISQPFVELHNVNTSGKIVLTGNAANTVIDIVYAKLGVVARPLVGSTNAYVNVQNSKISNVKPSKVQPYDMFPIALAHPKGEITIRCFPSTGVLIQPGESSAAAIDTSGCKPIIDLGELYSVYGGAIENIVLEEPPADDDKAFNVLLNQLIAVFAAIVTVEVVLLS